MSAGVKRGHMKPCIGVTLGATASALTQERRPHEGYFLLISALAVVPFGAADESPLGDRRADRDGAVRRQRVGPSEPCSRTRIQGHLARAVAPGIWTQCWSGAGGERSRWRQVVGIGTVGRGLLGESTAT